MGESRAEPFAGVDAAWLRMDDPTNLMMVTALLLLDGQPSVDSIYEVVERRLLRDDRFRQRVIEPRWRLGLPRWELDPKFDLGAHIARIQLGHASDDALREHVGLLMSTPLIE